MPDLTPAAPPPRPELLRELRLQLPAVAPGLRVVAHDLLGAQTAIDLVCVDPQGRAVLALIGEPARDLELVARGLAQRAWVARRLRDWLQLAPDLGIRPEAGVRVLLLAPEFGPEARTAVAALGADAPELWGLRCLRNGSGVAVVLEPPDATPPSPAASDRSSGEPSPPKSPAAPQPVFRTGLTEADLGVSPAERREFE